MNKKIIATFGKHMICPNINGNDLKEQGLDDFNDYNYRYISDNYKANSEYTNSILLEYLKKAIVNICDDSKIPLLLLSDGKDSLALAIALSELNLKAYTLTLLRKEDTNMKKYLQSISDKLELNSYFITVDEIVNVFDIEFFKNSFEYMNHPVLDQGYFFFLFGLKLFFEKNNLESSVYEVLDGLGNDEYFGYMMSKQQWQSFKLSQTELWKLLPKSLINFKWYLRSPAESHGDLSTLACFFNFDEAYDLNQYFSKIPKSTQREEYLDFRAFSRGSFHDHQCMMGKTDTAARYLGSNCVFPYLDKDLADYCFNIPIDEKLDFENIINKIPLRKLLNEKISWNQTKRGVDLYFDLDMDKFYDEIISKVVPKDLIDVIKNNKILNESVKKRAYLELLNFFTYCSVKEKMKDDEIRKLLG